MALQALANAATAPRLSVQEATEVSTAGDCSERTGFGLQKNVLFMFCRHSAPARRSSRQRRAPPTPPCLF
eukprot:scaffold18723_cov75-Phaeocystis_antarctica.AAC.2